MKPEKFDEILRRKLEGIQPTFQDDDWAKFRAYKQLHMPTSFWQQFGSTIMYSTAGLVATVLIVTNFYQYNQNQRMDAQLGILQKQLAQKEAALVQTAKVQPDTVYIDRYIALESTSSGPQMSKNQLNTTIESPNNTESNPVQNEEIATNEETITPEQSPNEPLEHREEILKSSITTTAIQKGILNKSRVSNTSTDHLPQNNQLFSDLNKQKTKQPSSKALVVKNKSRESVNKQEVTQNAQFNSLNDNPISENTSVDIVDNQLSNEKLSLSNTPAALVYNVQPLATKQMPEELTGLEPAEVKVKRYAYASVIKASREAETTEAKATPPPPSISLKNMKLRAGLGLNIGDRYLGYKVITSVLLGKHWSLDIGLSRTSINGPIFMTEDLLKARTQKDFHTWRNDKEKYPIKAPLALPIITNIQTGVDLVQMPIALTYRWPIKDGFTFLLSGGTNINLSAIQKYSYEYRERYSAPEQRNGFFDVKTAISNDVLIAAGIERQWRHLVLQAEAYTAPYLQKPTSYLSENRNLGVRFKLLYQFGKNYN